VPKASAASQRPSATTFNVAKASSKLQVMLVEQRNVNEPSAVSQRQHAPTLSVAKASSNLHQWTVERQNVPQASAASQKPPARTFNVAKVSSKLRPWLVEARSVNNRNVAARRRAAVISPATRDSSRSLKKPVERPRAPKTSAANLKPLVKASSVVKVTSRRQQVAAMQ